MNIGTNSAPNIQQIKRSILYDALYYNIREQEAKLVKKHIDRQKQKQDYKLINKRVSTQLYDDMQKQKEKKSYIQSLLSHQYEKQIEQKKTFETLQRNKNRGYAKSEQQSQKDYHDKRARQLARIYRAQRTYTTINPQLQQKQPSISYISPPLPQAQFQKQGLPKLNYQINQKNFNGTDQSRISESPGNYKDYLKQQIQRKKHQKQEQIKNRMQIEKQLSRYNQQKLLKQKQQLRQIQRRQQLAYKKGLDNQIAQKNYFKHHF